MAKCIHFGDPRTCARCSGSKTIGKTVARKPQPTRAETSVRTVNARTSSPIKYAGEVIVYTQREHNTWADVNSDTKLVHFNGLPFLWAVKRVVEKAPNLETLQIIPSSRRDIRDSHRAVLRAHGVELKFGYWRPELAGRAYSPPGHFATQQHFLQQLQGEQRVLFEELVAFGFPEIAIVSRYYCLAEEEPIGYAELAQSFGYEDKSASVNIMCRTINAVLRYLDPSFATAADSIEKARTIKERVEKLRALAESAEARVKYLKSLELTEELIPVGILSDRIEIFAQVRRLYLAKKIVSSRSVLSPRAQDIIVRRFGLVSGASETLESISADYDITRERVRQIEAQALRKLGVITED